MRLLQLPVTDLEVAIKEEVEKNPLLEAEMSDTEPLPQQDNDQSDWDADDEDNPFDYDYREHQERDPNATRHEYVMSDAQSATDRLLDQLHLRRLTDRQMQIATELIGTLDDAGYLGRDVELVANDLAFRRDIDTTPQEVEEVLRVVQSLDPAGVGARNLRECLLLQLQRIDNNDEATEHATAIVERMFDDFAEHRYAHICDVLGLTTSQFDAAAAVVRHLNPKPVGSSAADNAPASVVIPDIILTQFDGQLQFYVNDAHLPRLSLDTYYTEMLHDLQQQHGDAATIRFLQTKQSEAQLFIDLLQQRHDTITRIMRVIVKRQRRFLLTGNPDLLMPLKQQDVAEATGLDASTVSRMANSKYLQTDFGIIALKECFSKSLATQSGEEVAVERVKQRLSEIVDQEDKKAPLSDDALAERLNAEGLQLARRTVAKYREQLGIPVARLRRALVLLLFLFAGTTAMGQVSYYDSIIAVRLNKAAEQPKQQLGKADARPEPAAKKSKKTQPAPRPKVEVGATLPAAAEHTVPMWYADFPSHRVNPRGRTDLTDLPDEINLTLCRDSSDFCFPVRGVRSSPYGWRWQRGHHGVDIALHTGDPVHAAFGGTVRVASRMGGYGNCIVVRHPNGLETLYGHLSQINVKVGQAVAAGDVVGLGGSTGNSTGPHLHFECRFLYQTFDPEWILDIEHQSLRTRRLHLDKSYFGIRQPKRGEAVDYKADQSKIKEGKKRPKNQPAVINPKDF